MAVVKEWHCTACGSDFDSDIPACGQCGAASEPIVARAFRTAPGYKGDKTKILDQSLQNFTKFYGLSDFTNNKSTKHEKDFSSLWKPTTDLMTDAAMQSAISSAGEAALIKSIGKDAASPIGKNKIIVGKEKTSVGAS